MHNINIMLIKKYILLRLNNIMMSLLVCYQQEKDGTTVSNNCSVIFINTGRGLAVENEFY